MFGYQSRKPRVLLQIVMTVLAMLWLLPSFAGVSASLRGDGLANYATALSFAFLPRAVLNTLIIAAGTIACVYVAVGLASYALATLRLRGKEIIYVTIVAGLLVPSVGLSVPIFVAVRALGLVNNPLGVILPLVALSVPFHVVLVRSFIEGIPQELLDAARVDGAGTFQVLWWLVRPLAWPIAAVSIVLTFLGSWNEFFLPLIILQGEGSTTVSLIPVLLAPDRLNPFAPYGPVFAAYVLISAPVIAVYLGVQRYFEMGLVGGALK